MTRRFGFPATVALAGALLIVASLATNAPAASGIPYELSKLDNGLPVYRISDERMGDYVALRLVVFPPPFLPGTPEHRTFQTLMRSLFRGKTAADDLFEFLDDTPHAAHVRVGYHRAGFAFDVFPSDMDSLFTRIAGQWERGLFQTQIDVGQTDTGTTAEWYTAPAIERLALLTGCDWKDTLGAGSAEVAAMFRSHMNAWNMALVISGPRAGVERAMRLAKYLEIIPAGERSTAPPVGYGNALHRRTIRFDEGPWAIGLRVPVPSDPDPAASNFYFRALLRKLNDVVSGEKGLVYGVPGRFFMGADEHIMVFELLADEDVARYGKIAREIQRVAAGMADASALSWWKTFTEGERRSDTRLWGALTAASSAAEALSRLVTRAHMVGRDELESDYMPSADEALSTFAAMLESGEWFVVEPLVSRKDALMERLDGVVAYIYGGLFGPTDDRRALAVLCQCLLLLIVFRRVEKRMGQKRPATLQKRPINRPTRTKLRSTTSAKQSDTIVTIVK